MIRVCPTICLAAMLTVMMLAAGCEQRVVGVKNRWAGGQMEGIAQQNYQFPGTEQPEPSALDKVGDTLFGWTKAFAKEDEPQQPPRQPLPQQPPQQEPPPGQPLPAP